MKLYLSSFHLGREPEVLGDLVGRTGRAGIVFNALDSYPDRLRDRNREVNDIVALGFECDELDLRDYFEDFDGLRRRLDEYVLLWVIGGNAFLLARAMTRVRFNEAIGEPLGRESLTYAGYSAGICVTGPDLRGIHLMDEPDVIPDGYREDDNPTTLNWVPWRIVPHWRSAHSEAPAAELAAEYLAQRGLPFRALQDGQAIVINGEDGCPL